MPATWTNTQITNNLVRSGLKWNGSTISYGFPAAAPSWSFSTGEGPGFSALTSTQKDAARLAIQLWDDLIAPDFVETTSAANVTFQNTTSDIGYAHAYFPGGASASGSVWFNRGYDASQGTNDLVTPEVGQWGFLTYVHELGHALGLSHPGNYNGGNPTYANDALYAQDSIMYSVMSYFDASNTGADWRASDGNRYYAQTPMLHDVLAIQALYGVETNTRAGDTRYGFNATAGVAVFDFTQNAHPILTIWDGGGNDWLDLSGFATASRIDLNPGTFSDCDGMTMNVAIAYACDIENAAGGSGSDSITGNVLANILQGNGGNDTLVGGAGDDRLEGGTGSDTLRGGTGADILLGGDGNDLFYADQFDYLLQFDGGAGYDILYFYGTPAVAFAYGDYGFEEMWLFEISNIITGTAAADVLTGTDIDETINGLGGNDTINGGGGDDTISGDAGDDRLDGGLGTDTVTYQGALAGVTVSLAQTTAQNTGGAGRDTILGVENLTGSGFNDTLTGSNLANVLTGLAGNDMLNGGLGADTMVGGDGNDTYVVDHVGDIVDEAGGDGTDTVQSSVAFSLAALGLIENLTLTGTAVISGTGNDLDNVITGNLGANVLTGHGGNDSLNGGLGADTMIGGSGNDTYVLDNAGDVADETDGDGTDTIQSSLTFSLSDAIHAKGEFENLTLTGSSAINGTGNGFANVVTGNGGNNVLAGLAGADTLAGGAGTDTATYAASAAGVNVSLMTGLGSGGDAEGDTLSTIENLTGSNLDDTLEGNGGNNVLAGGLGNDTVSYEHALAGVTVNLATATAQSTVGAGTDTLSGFENLTGSGFNDTLTGTTGNNILLGLDGNDTLNGGLGADTMIGGDGNDTYVVDQVGDIVDETGGDGIDTVQSALFFSLAALGLVENLTLTGTSAIAGTGNDLDNVITGNSGANILTGHGGNDTLNGGAGADTMIGGGGNDIYMVDHAGDVADEIGGYGTDTVQSSLTFSLLDAIHAKGEFENLTLTGSGVINGTGNDLANVIAGNGGNNVLAGLGGADNLAGGGGTDTATYAASAAGVNVSLTTGLGSGGDAEGDTLSTLENLTGSSLDDTLEGNGGNNVLAGGLGVDTISYEHALAGVTVNLATATAQGTVGAGLDTLSGFENLTGSGFHDTLTGTTGNNVLLGLDGNDTLNGGLGADTMIGGAGNDTYFVDNAGDTVNEIDNEGSDKIQSSIAFSLAAMVFVENLTLTGTAAIAGTGNDLDNVIAGNSGANILTGLGGNDTLNGGLGADTMIGGSGNDTYVLDNAGDVADETDGDGTDTIQSSLTFSLSDAIHAKGEFENLTLTGSSAINGTGNGFANVITGNGGNNVLAGLGGADNLAGGAGTDTATYAASAAGVNVSLMTGLGSGGDAEGDMLSTIENLTGSNYDDTLEGNGGNNVLTGGLGVDTVSYEHALAGVTVNLATATAQSTVGAGTDTLSGFENLTGSGFNDKLTGSAGNNILAGLAGNDTLSGGAGLDRLIGGAGKDTLTGGSQADQFVFSALTDSAVGTTRDLITDFAVGVDKIDLVGIDALLGGADDQFEFIGTGGFSANAGELRYAASGGQTVVEGDTDGDGVADFQIGLTGAFTLNEFDFIL